jgi:hypothetical protein
MPTRLFGWRQRNRRLIKITIVLNQNGLVQTTDSVIDATFPVRQTFRHVRLGTENSNGKAM